MKGRTSFDIDTWGPIVLAAAIVFLVLGPWGPLAKADAIQVDIQHHPEETQ